MRDVSKLKILIADDHFLARQIVADVMRDMNVTDVTVVGDGKSARDAMLDARKAGLPYDVVYLDHNMPGIEGLDLLQQFRSQPGFRSTAFIMFTSVSEQGSVMKAVQAGVAAYLIKPMTKQAIGKKLLDAAAWLEQQKKLR